MTGDTALDRSSFTDICVFCDKVSGANLSVGYHGEHKRREHLVIGEWQHTLDLCQKWLANPNLPGFRIPGK